MSIFDIIQRSSPNAMPGIESKHQVDGSWSFIPPMIIMVNINSESFVTNKLAPKL